MQVHLRRRAMAAARLMLPFASGDVPVPALPCFEVLASLRAVCESEFYGPAGVGYVPKRL